MKLCTYRFAYRRLKGTSTYTKSHKTIYYLSTPFNTQRTPAKRHGTRLSESETNRTNNKINIIKKNYFIILIHMSGHINIFSYKLPGQY